MLKRAKTKFRPEIIIQYTFNNNGKPSENLENNILIHLRMKKSTSEKKELLN